MTRKKIILLCLLVLILLLFWGGYSFFKRNSGVSNLQTASADRRELKAVISTNGVVEPIDRSEVFAPFDGFVTLESHQEGEVVTKGERLFRVESEQLATALASARAALLQARLQAQPVLSGPPKEELAGIEASISETEWQLRKNRQDLEREENLFKRNATARVDVENRREQVNLLELRLETLNQKKQSLVNRFSPKEKEWEANKISELSQQVELLALQLESGSILSPRSGRIYALDVKSRAFVRTGQLLAQIYEPGHIRVKAYVDEPDLGRIEKGQQVEVEWDGMPDRRWPAKVEQLAQQVLSLGNRSVGFVFCSVEGNPVELIPNINLKLQIVTSRKSGALVVPRAAVFNHNGQSTVLLFNGSHTVTKPVVLGMVTPQEVEILQGLEAGSRVVINPGEVSVP